MPSISTQETPEARSNKLQDFLAVIVNAPSLPGLGMALHPEVGLLDIGDFTLAEVASLAYSAPKDKATGPDDVPVEIHLYFKF